MKKIDDYLVDLSSDDEKVRLAAVMALGDSEDEAAISVLAKMKVDPSSGVRFYAKKSILKLKTKFQKPDADETIEISDEAREKILKLKNLEKIKDRSKIDKLFADLETETNHLVKSTIVSVLGKLCDDKHLETLMKLTESADSRIVANAVEALESVGSDKTIDPLTRLLFHEDSRVKANVCKALWKFAPAKKDIAQMVMSRLRELIASDKPWIRSSAIFVLSEINTEEALTMIKGMKNDPEKIIKDQAVETLKKLGVTEAPPPMTEEQKARIEELPPDDFIPKVKFFWAKFAKYAGEKYEIFREYISDEDNRALVFRRIKLAFGGLFALFFFIVVFNAIWELKYPPQKKVTAVKTSEKQEEIVSNAVLEAAGDLRDLQFEESIAKLEKELGKNPYDVMAKKLLSVAYNQQSNKLLASGRAKEAAELAQKAIDFSPEFPEAYISLAKAQVASKDGAKAIETLKTGVSRNDKNHLLLYEYGKALLSQSGGAAEARASLQKAVEAEPANGAYHYAMARCLLTLKETGEARLSYAKAVTLEPKRYELRRELIDLFINNEMVPEAMTELKAAVEFNAKDQKSRETLANVYFITNNYIGAAEELKVLLTETPGNAELNFKLGLCYQAMENVDEMFKYVYKAVKLNPNFAEGYHALGTIYEFKKNLPSAKTCYDSAIKLKPNFPGGYVSLGRMYMNSNQYPYAITVFTNALRNIPDNQEILYYLGLSYMKQKDGKNARESFSKLLGLLAKESAEYKHVSGIISSL